MQIREIALTELETAYEAVKELRDITYDEFEDLIYAMRHQEYKMFGSFDAGELICFAGVSVQVNLYWKRHLFVYELVTRQKYRSQGHGREMLLYLGDYARMLGCGRIALSSGLQREAAHRFYEKEGFEKKGYTFLKSL